MCKAEDAVRLTPVKDDNAAEYKKDRKDVTILMEYEYQLNGRKMFEIDYNESRFTINGRAVVLSARENSLAPIFAAIFTSFHPNLLTNTQSITFESLCKMTKKISHKSGHNGVSEGTRIDLGGISFEVSPRSSETEVTLES